MGREYDPNRSDPSAPPMRASRRYERAAVWLLFISRVFLGARGGNSGRRRLLRGMTDQEASPTPDLLDVLVDQLLACGAPISQMMASMQKFEASGLSAPDAPPAFEVAHSLIRGVVDDLTERYSDDEIRTAAEIVAQATIAICDNIFIIPPSEVRRLRGGSSRNGARRRQHRRSGRGRR